MRAPGAARRYKVLRFDSGGSGAWGAASLGVYTVDGALLAFGSSTSNGNGTQGSGRSGVYELCDAFTVPSKPSGVTDGPAARPQGAIGCVARYQMKRCGSLRMLLLKAQVADHWATLCFTFMRFRYNFSITLGGLKASSFTLSYVQLRLTAAVAMGSNVPTNRVVFGQANDTTVANSTSSSAGRRRQAAELDTRVAARPQRPVPGKLAAASRGEAAALAFQAPLGDGGLPTEPARRRLQQSTAATNAVVVTVRVNGFYDSAAAAASRDQLSAAVASGTLAVSGRTLWLKQWSAQGKTQCVSESPVVCCFSFHRHLRSPCWSRTASAASPACRGSRWAASPTATARRPRASPGPGGS